MTTAALVKKYIMLNKDDNIHKSEAPKSEGMTNEL